MKKEIKEEVKNEEVVELDELVEATEPVKKTRGRKAKAEKVEEQETEVVEVKEETEKVEEPQKTEVVEEKIKEVKETPLVETSPKNETKAEEKPVINIDSRKKIVINDNFGVESVDVAEDERKKREKLERFYSKLRKYKDEEKVLWGYVSGAESDQSMAGAVVVWSDGEQSVRIVIPDNAYFMPNSVFPKGYKDADKKGQIAARKQIISYEINAKICFVITSLMKTKDGPVLMGSRVRAMRKLQDRYFYHLNDKTLAETGTKIGDITKANVLYVRAYNVLVECLGVETYLDAFNLSNEAVDNCFDFVKPGDTVKVRIKKIHINEQDKEGVYLTVSGRLNASSEQIKNIKKGATYAGVIKGYNKANACYTVRLKDGINVSVLKRNVNKRLNLVRNDKVIVLVTSVKEDYVMGSIVTQI